MAQRIITGPDCHLQIEHILEKSGISKFLLVHDAAYPQLCLSVHIDALSLPHAVFEDFTSNPLYEDIVNGMECFHTKGCDGIVAIGGGSAIDVAKCIKLFSGLDADKNYLRQPFHGNEIPLIVLPTTAGTGSESTHFAVLYEQGEKQSVAHESIIPDWVLLDPGVLETLPIFQKKCTLMDALCQGIESWWSVRATDESMAHAEEAIHTIVMNMDTYLSSWDVQVTQRIQFAANRAGQAINITQTTAPHAMSYKLTSLYGLPHGYAAAVCLPKVWAYMLAHPENCVHPKGWDGLQAIFFQIAHALGQTDPGAAITFWENMLSRLGLEGPRTTRQADIELLTRSVNVQRLHNNPSTLQEDALWTLYSQIVTIDPA